MTQNNVDLKLLIKITMKIEPIMPDWRKLQAGIGEVYNVISIVQWKPV